MGKLHLGEMTEMTQRLKSLEDTEVVKMIHEAEADTQSDVVVVMEE